MNGGVLALKKREWREWYQSAQPGDERVIIAFNRTARKKMIISVELSCLRPLTLLRVRSPIDSSLLQSWQCAGSFGDALEDSREGNTTPKMGQRCTCSSS